MPIEIRSDQARDLTIATLEGVVTFHDIMAAIESFYSQPTKKIIWDSSNCQYSQLTHVEVQKLATFPLRYSDLRKDGKTAIVAREDLSFGLSRMFQAFGQAKDLPFSIEVFRELGDAMQWIAEPNIKE